MLDFLKNIFSLEKENTRIIITILGIRMKFFSNLNRNKNNKVYIVKDGVKKEFRGKIKDLKIRFNGENNSVIINYPYKFKTSKILIEGNNNQVILDKNVKLRFTRIFLEYINKHKRKVYIGENTVINGADLFVYATNSEILIGKDCMFSWDVIMLSGDGHIITPKGSNEVINKGHGIKIGDHVWVGQGVFIGKNVEIGDNNIIGAKSVVAKSFLENNVAIGGNPAKIIKTDIDWKEEDYYD